MKKEVVLCMFILAVGLLCISTSFGKYVPVKVSTYHINKADSTIIPYITVGYGHSGSYTIRGCIYYKYNGYQRWQYSDSGRIYSIFTKYWGWKFKAPYIYSWRFSGAAYY
ncbi:MAG: hypothetical protein ACP5C3_01850 [Methanomicrobiales archaeon]